MRVSDLEWLEENGFIFNYNYLELTVEKLYEFAQFVEKCFGIPLPVHEAIVGENVFHTSQVYTFTGILKIHSLTNLYHQGSLEGKESFYLGKHGGKHQIKLKLKKAGIKASEEQILTILNKVKKWMN